jgi:hypothetical protein
LNADGVRTLYIEGTVATLHGKVMTIVQMNHPPFVLTLLRAWAALQRATGLPLGFWMRGCCAIADVFAIWLLWRLTRRRRGAWRALLVVAAAPAGIMISGFHGNTDPIMIAFSVAAACLLEMSGPAWLAGLAFGLSCSIKVWPLVLFPTLFLGACTFRRRLEFVAGTAVAAACAALPWFAAAPELILRRTLDYSPVRGWWGISYLAPGAVDASRYVAFACCLIAAICAHRWTSSLLARCAVVTGLFLFLAPGFGPQYLAWILPWTLAAGWRSAAIFQASAGLYLFGMYNTWSLGLPWYFGNAYNLYEHPFPAWVLPSGVVTWSLLLLIVASAWWRHRVSRRGSPDDKQRT